jgi:Phage major capsid protein E.
MPAQSDLHVNAPLTNVSVAYLQNSSRFLATRVFPKVKVEKQSDLYWKYSKSDWRRTDVQRRAPSTETPGVGWSTTTDQYFAHVYGVHKDIDDQLRANADSNFHLDSDATKFITNQLLLKRDIDWAARYFVTGVWGTELTGVASAPTAGQFIQWDQAASDPLSDYTDWEADFDELTGFTANKMVVGSDVWKALKNHDAILDRIKYTQKGVVTEDLVASFFGVEEFIVAKATKATGPQIADAVAQDAAATYSRLVDKKSALICYAPSSPSLLTPSAGYTFVWNGYLGSGGGEGIRIKNYRMENIASDRIEAEMTYDQKVVSPDMGVFLNSVVA